MLACMNIHDSTLSLRRMMARTCRVLFVAVALLAGASRVEATSVKQMSMREIADLSAQVCWATVESSTPRWSEGRRAIETVLHLQGVEFLKGDGAQEFDWVVPGGTIDGITMSIAGAPTFLVGERWMLCLLPSWKTHPCAGIWQGAFRVEESTRGPIVRGAMGVVTGLSAETFVAYMQSSAQHLCTPATCTQAHPAQLTMAMPSAPISVDDFNALLQPILKASALVPLPLDSIVGARVWTTSHAVPFRVDAVTPANPPAKRAAAGARRPKSKVNATDAGATR